jgi:uncharacterized protein YtpQ (UPF0354 family)
LGLFDFFRPTPTRDKFSQLALKAFADTGYPYPLRYDAEEFRLVGATDASRIINLTNAYMAYCNAPRKQRRQALLDFVRGMHAPDLPTTFAEARDKLLPVIRGRGALEYVRLLPETLDSGVPYIDAFAPLSADSVIMLACDSERTIQTLTGATLKNWGVSFDEALAVATDNLRDASAPKFERAAPGIFVGNWGDSYDASRLLFSDLFYRLELGGEPVAMAPTRQRLLAASANDKVALMGMLALARSAVEQEGRQVSALMYRFEGGKPVEFVSDDADVNAMAQDLKKIFLQDDYHSQKQLLDKLNTKANLDVFVASYKLLQSQDSGRIFSYGVWTDNVDTLLPEVDKVALVRYHEESGEPDTRVVAWEELRAQFAELQQAVPGYPVRYRLSRFPSREQLDGFSSTGFDA